MSSIFNRIVVMSQDSLRSRKPGQRAKIDTADVVRAATVVCSQRGISGLTMRAVANELGVAANALYSHIRDKMDLVDAVIDSLLIEVRIPDYSTEWQEALFQLMSSSREVLLRFSDLMPLFLARPMRGPNARRLGEATLEFLAQGGVTEGAAVQALRILLIFTFGFAAQEAPRTENPSSPMRRNVSNNPLETPHSFPRMRALAELLSKHPDQEMFTKGLRWLIKSIAEETSGSNRD